MGDMDMEHFVGHLVTMYSVFYGYGSLCFKRSTLSIFPHKCGEELYLQYHERQDYLLLTLCDTKPEKS